MSTRGTLGRGTRGRSRGRGSTRARSLASGHMPNVEAWEAPASPVTETGSYDRAAGDDVLSQAMLRILERVAGISTGAVGCGSISERLRLNGAEIFRGISRVAPNMAEYWLEATERIMDDLDYTSEQKLKGPKKKPSLMGQSELGFLLQDYNLVLIVGDITWVSAGRSLGHASDPSRGRGQARGGNGMGRDRRTSGRDVDNIEMRQPALVYATRHIEYGDALDVITAKDEIPPRPAKEQLKRKWDDEDIDDSDIMESWEEEDELAPPS
ncbi:hypothetical protein Golax_005341, partial [Gossypium laxum]|nr:hypothetical protein [Gossypium laxum]